jgi:ribosome assembly protein RRB1
MTHENSRRTDFGEDECLMMDQNQTINGRKVEEKHTLDYEDDFDDEFEDENMEEDEWESCDEDYEEVTTDNGTKLLANKKKLEGIEKHNQKDIVPFMGNETQIKQDEYLDFENGAYSMLHRANTEWPCLSCDFLSGQVSTNNSFPLHTPNIEKNIDYPMEVYAVAGSQASLPSKNKIYVMRMANLLQTMYDDDPENVGELGEFNDGNPIIVNRSIPIKGGINRIRSMQGYGVVALWSETRKVKIYNIDGIVNELKNVDITKKIERKSRDVNISPIANFSSICEGYALEWSPHIPGMLASGNCNGELSLFTAADENCSSFKKYTDYSFHMDSLEDIQFAPNDQNGIATCGCDGVVNFIDMREGKTNPVLQLQAGDDCDVNVISWNPSKPTLIATGLDNGSFKVFDIRFPEEEPITFVDWHEGPITSIQWQPDDQWTLAVASDDNRLSIWDFSVEDGDNAPMDQEGHQNVPDQIIFLHQGQDHIKELRWSPNKHNTIMTTALNGFNVFQPGTDQTGSALGIGENDNTLDLIPE